MVRVNNRIGHLHRSAKVFTQCALVVSMGAVFSDAWANVPDSTVPNNASVNNAPAAPADSADANPSSVIVTGVRGVKSTVLKSSSPVDIVTAAQLKATGKVGLKELLTELLPSFNLPGVNGGGTSWTVRATTLRGLQGDQVLYLVNGKRRHTTALINNLARIGNGGVPVDLDLIPVGAIDHIEVLRDGAAAQYGSDAIAGVINIILKKTDSGGEAAVSGGQNYDGDSNGGHGGNGHVALDWGTKLGTDGFVHYALDYKDNAPTNRAVNATGTFYNPLPNGQPDPRNNTIDPKTWGLSYGPGRDQIFSSSYNLEVPIDALTLYSFSTLSHRDSLKVTGSFLPNNSDSLPQVYPNGFNAERRIDETDFQFAGGLRGQLGEWNWDLSTSLGQDNASLDGLNTINASLGPSSPTSFNLATQIYNEWINNLDFNRKFNIGLEAPLNLSWGLEERREEYRILPGDPDSYANGTYTYDVNGAVVHPTLGLASYTGTSPDASGAVSRTNDAAYIDLSQSLTPQLNIGLAGRAEHYSDSSGNTLSGKFSTRYEFLPGYAIRGTIGNGFRAPSLAQEIYASSTFSGGVNSAGQYVIYPLKVLPSTSAEAQDLGASPLRPEKSTNYSLGLTAQPVHALKLTLDAYQIDIKDRILETTALSGQTVYNVLQANGYTPVSTSQSVQYYTNAANTQTRGLDLVGEYTTDFDNYGVVKWNAGLALDHTTVQSLKPTPAVLSNIGYQLFGHQQQSDLTKGTPTNKLLLGTDWVIDRFDINLHFTRYGSYTEAATTAQFDRVFSPKWITDLDVAYKVTPKLTFALGANNLFNVYPSKAGIIQTSTGTNQYGIFSPFGITGGYYYARADYKF